MHYVKMAFSACFFLLIGNKHIALADEHPGFREPIRQEFILQNGEPDYQFTNPFIFRRGTWVQVALDEDAELLICVSARSRGGCVFTNEAPGEIWGAGITPNCQGAGTLALTFEVHRDPEPYAFVYFVDGLATLNREEAERWANETPGCTFDTVDEEW